MSTTENVLDSTDARMLLASAQSRLSSSGLPNKDIEEALWIMRKCALRLQGAPESEIAEYEERWRRLMRLR